MPIYYQTPAGEIARIAGITDRFGRTMLDVDIQRYQRGVFAWHPADWPYYPNTLTPLPPDRQPAGDGHAVYLAEMLPEGGYYLHIFDSPRDAALWSRNRTGEAVEHLVIPAHAARGRKRLTIDHALDNWPVIEEREALGQPLPARPANPIPLEAEDHDARYMLGRIY